MQTTTVARFLDSVASLFPDDRLTYQKGIPTFHPESASEAGLFISQANDFGQKLFITGFGNNIDPVGDRFARIVSIRNDRLNAIISCEEQALRVEVGSGFPLRELNIKLRGTATFNPMAALPYVGSVGGAIAVGLSADRSVRSTTSAPVSISRFLLGLTVVTPTGEIRTIGTSDNKSSSQEDFARAYSPSWGLLGFIVSATLRLLPDSAHSEWRGLKQRGIDQEQFLANLRDENSYLGKVRAKFDSRELFPIFRAKESSE